MTGSNNTNSTTICIVEPPDVLLITIGSLAALLNGLLLLVLYNERKKFFRTRVSYLVANLSVADCLTGAWLVVVMVLRIVDRVGSLKVFQFFVLCLTVHVSFLTLILMSLDRMVVAVLPMTWSTILTVKRTIIGVALAWLLSILWGTILHYYVNKKRLAMLLFWEISVVLFIAIHLFVYQFLKRHRRRSQSSTSSEISTVVDLTLQASHRQITSVVLTLMLVLVMTYIPYIISLNIVMANAGTDMEIQIADPVFRYTQAFSYFNYAANPIVYAWRLRVYRNAFCRMLKLAC